MPWKYLCLQAWFAAIITPAFSQITFTGANLPQPGFTYLTYTDTTPSIALGTPGPNSQNWNFSSLISDYPSVPTYGPTSWTPYAGVFTTSNMYTYGPAALYSSLFGGAPVNSQGMNKGYMFWKGDNTGFWAVGFRADSGTYANINVFYNPPELLIGAPCTYNSSFNNTARWEFPMNIYTADPDTYYVCRTVKTITGDAWGSLTTPYGSFPNVIREHEYVIKYDSVYVKVGSTVIWSTELMRDTSNNYIYLSNTINYPAAIVHADVNNTVESVEWYTGYLAGYGEPGAAGSSLVYPVPGPGLMTFVFTENTGGEFVVSDLNGQVLFKSYVDPNCREVSLDLSFLDAGTYLATRGGGQVYKFIIRK